MNAELILPLESMSVIEKMEVVDRIMDDLSRNAESIPEIEWHGEELERRAANLKNGTDRFISLEDAEKLIRKKTGRQ